MLPGFPKCDCILTAGILHFLEHILGKPILYAWYEVRND